MYVLSLLFSFKGVSTIRTKTRKITIWKTKQPPMKHERNINRTENVNPKRPGMRPRG